MDSRPFVRLLVLLTAAAVLRLPGSAEAAAPAKARVEIPEAICDFGSVRQGEKVSRKFTIRNTGSRDLVLGDAELSGAGIATVRMRGRIAPGGAADVAVTMDTRRLSGDVEAGVAFATNDPERPRVELALKGRVKQLVEVLPLSRIAIATFKNDSAEGAVTIVNNDNVPLRITGVESGSNLFRAEVDVVKEGAEYRLRIASSAAAPAGRHEGWVTLRTNNGRVPRLSIAVNLLVRNKVYASPDEIDFGKVRREELAQRPKLVAVLTQTVIVKRRAGTDFRIEIDSAVPYVKVVTGPAADNAACRLDVFLVPENLAPGRINGVLRVRTNDAEFPLIAIPIKGEVI